MDRNIKNNNHCWALKPVEMGRDRDIIMREKFKPLGHLAQILNHLIQQHAFAALWGGISRNQ